MFGVEFTWLGWIWIFLAAFSVVIQAGRGLLDIDNTTTSGESGFAAILGVLLIVGFFTVGFVE